MKNSKLLEVFFTKNYNLFYYSNLNFKNTFVIDDKNIL